MSINFPESGYTPDNYNALLQYSGLNIKQFSELTGIKYRSAQNYSYPLDNQNHQDMPLTLWLDCVEKVELLKNRFSEKIKITETEHGDLSVAFPIELKDRFKHYFYKKRWNSDTQSWEVPREFKAKLEGWVHTVNHSGVLEAIQDKKDREAMPNDLNTLRHELKLMRQKVALHSKAADELERSNNLVSKMSYELQCLKEQLAEDDAKAKTAVKGAREALNGIIDKSVIDAQIRIMCAEITKVGSQAKTRFEKAQAVLQEQQERLKNVGLRSRGIGLLVSANFNRPDRDNPRLITDEDIYTIVSIVNTV